MKKKKKKEKKEKKEKLKRGRPKKVFLQEKVEQLIAKGRERGFVTISEILYFFPEVEQDIKGLERLYERLERAGIEIKGETEFLDLEKEIEEEIPEAKLDEVQMYLKEIGQYPPLTAEEEKELAKRIEKGDQEAKKD